LVEHVTENHGVGGSIPPLGTKQINHLAKISGPDENGCVRTVSAPTMEDQMVRDELEFTRAKVRLRVVQMRKLG
jgi:hypothetical protein